MYDLIGVLGYFIIIGFAFSRKRLLEKSACLGSLTLYLKEHREHLRSFPKKAEKLCNDQFWAKKEILLLFFLHVVTFTFFGEMFGKLIGRGTDFFGYVVGTNIAFCIACYFLGLNAFQELDNLVPIYLSIASLLKLSCFCAGCCNGREWEGGLYNHATARYEFPIQLVEGFVYLLLLLVFRLSKKRLPTGYTAPLFLISFSAFRFFIQFFRTDEEVFSLFHFIPFVAFILGLLHLFAVHNYGQKIEVWFRRKVRISRIEKKLLQQ